MKLNTANTPKQLEAYLVLVYPLMSDEDAAYIYCVFCSYKEGVMKADDILCSEYGHNARVDDFLREHGINVISDWANQVIGELEQSIYTKNN